MRIIGKELCIKHEIELSDILKKFNIKGDVDAWYVDDVNDTLRVVTTQEVE